MNIPSAAGFVRELATQFGPALDPANPFFKPATVAVHRLLIQAVAEVFGPQDPFSQFASAFERAYVLSFPVRYSEAKAEALEGCIDDMRSSWEVMERDFAAQAEAMREKRP